MCGSYADISSVSLSPRSYCVIMTQGHEHDEEVLDQLLLNRRSPTSG